MHFKPLTTFVLPMENDDMTDDQQFIDFSQFREKCLETSYSEIIDTSLPLGLQVQGLISRVTKLPNPEIQEPILASCMVTPSTMSTISPIVFLYGATGTGKSAIGVLVTKLFRGTSPLMGTATACSIRNEINNQKWLDFPDCNFEKPYALVWDDINLLLFSVEIFTILKCGFSRETSITTIAGQGGVNIRFDTYGPKFISSCQAIWSMPEYVELKRRSLVFHTKSMADFKQLPDDLTLFDYESVDFSGLADLFSKFWHDQNNLAEYARVKKSLSQMRGKVKNLQLFKITLDAMTSGVITGIFADELEAINALIRYSEYLNEFINIKPPSITLLESFLAEQQAKQQKENDQYKELGLPTKPIAIKPLLVKAYLKQEWELGNLEVNIISNPFIHDLMTSFGWHTGKLNGETYWIKKVKS